VCCRSSYLQRLSFQEDPKAIAKSARIVRRHRYQRQIALLAILNERQDAPLHFFVPGTATPAISQVLFDASSIVREQFPLQRQERLILVRDARRAQTTRV
jgi:hypothetical protein